MINKINEYIKSITSFEDNTTLWDAMRYSLYAGGKRVRPQIVLMGCRALGGNEDKALSYAAALEMIHTYSLIHDDLPAMDNDDLRRGKPTCHKKFDEATAILAGDGLLTLAFEVAAKAPLSKKQNLQAVALLSKAAGPYGMVLGQAKDMQMDFATPEKLLDMYARKTGDLLYAAAALGCIAAGKDENLLEEYARAVGKAFQIRDDILDIIGSEEELGKPINSDEKNDKKTYAALVGIDKATEEVSDLTEKAIKSIEFLGECGTELSEFARKLVLRKN